MDISSSRGEKGLSNFKSFSWDHKGILSMIGIIGKSQQAGQQVSFPNFGCRVIENARLRNELSIYGKKQLLLGVSLSSPYPVYMGVKSLMKPQVAPIQGAEMPVELWEYLNIDSKGLELITLQPPSSTLEVKASAKTSIDIKSTTVADWTIGGKFKAIMPAYMQPSSSSNRLDLKSSRRMPVSLKPIELVASAVSPPPPPATASAKERIRHNIQQRLRLRMMRNEGEVSTLKRLPTEEEAATTTMKLSTMADNPLQKGRRTKYSLESKSFTQKRSNRMIIQDLATSQGGIRRGEEDEMMIPPFLSSPSSFNSRGNQIELRQSSSSNLFDFFSSTSHLTGLFDNLLGPESRDQPRAALSSSLQLENLEYEGLFTNINRGDGLSSSTLINPNSVFTLEDSIVLNDNKAADQFFSQVFDRMDYYSEADFDELFITPTTAAAAGNNSNNPFTTTVDELFAPFF